MLMGLCGATVVSPFPTCAIKYHEAAKLIDSRAVGQCTTVINLSDLESIVL